MVKGELSALLFAAVVSPVGAAVILTQPPDGAMVPLVSEAVKEYYAQPAEDRLAGLESVEKRAAWAKTLSNRPLSVVLQWRDTGAAEGVRPRYVVDVVRERDGLPFAHAETYKTHKGFENFEIATAYRWNVRAVCGDRISAEASGRFVTEDVAPRMIHWGVSVNCRDFGGRRGLGGRRIRQGLVYRSGGLNPYAKWEERRLPDGTVFITNRVASPCDRSPAVLRETVDRWGIRTDLDLRNVNEVWGMTGSPLGNGVSWIHAPSLWYGRMGEAAAKAGFAKAFRVFLDRRNYPVLFHCGGGADRTGSLGYILQGLLGVPDDELQMDWEATLFGNGNVKTFCCSARYRQLVKTMAALPGESTRERLEAYVRGCGFTDADIAKFRMIMLEGRTE